MELTQSERLILNRYRVRVRQLWPDEVQDTKAAGQLAARDTALRTGVSPERVWQIIRKDERGA